ISRAPQEIVFTIFSYQVNLFGRAVGLFHIFQRLPVYRKLSYRTTKFRGHVVDSGPVSLRVAIQPVAENFNKLPNYTYVPKEPGDGEHHICSRTTFRDLACKFQAYHLWAAEINRLAQHCCFSFNSAYTPTQNSNSVHHRRVG